MWGKKIKAVRQWLEELCRIAFLFQKPVLLPIITMKEIKKHHVCSINKLALDRQKFSICWALWWALLPKPMQNATVSDLAVTWTWRETKIVFIGGLLAMSSWIAIPWFGRSLDSLHWTGTLSSGGWTRWSVWVSSNLRYFITQQNRHLNALVKHLHFYRVSVGCSVKVLIYHLSFTPNLSNSHTPPFWWILLTPCWLSSLPGAINLHSFWIYTPALTQLHVTLNCIKGPWIQALRDVGDASAVDVSTHQDPLLLQLAEG